MEKPELTPFISLSLKIRDPLLDDVILGPPVREYLNGLAAGGGCKTMRSALNHARPPVEQWTGRRSDVALAGTLLLQGQQTADMARATLPAGHGQQGAVGGPGVPKGGLTDEVDDGRELPQGRRRA